MNQQNCLEAVLEDYLLKNIPISSAMGVRVNLASNSQIILEAPFSNNINHKKTVFGGSLHAIATLACWSLMHINMIKINGGGDIQIVIASSEIKYLLPINTDFKAECHKPDIFEWERFIKILLKKGKARVKLCAKIFKEGQLCVDYYGTFVGIRTSEQDS
ncbi:MAG: YiiD C-terminal domain-containing protein [Parachlamydiaceae bacterium]|nr:YiiD C-terminal domain-containing protein [Parachlamydiaceae bacterium]